MDITIFLTDTADGYNTSRNLIFREWDGTRGDAEARMASAGEDGTITLNFTEDTHESVEDLLERVYAATNGMPNLIDRDVTERYYEHEVRSLSVGDIVHVPGEGLFAVANMGFTRMHLHLPSDGFKGVTVSRGIRFRAVCPMCSEHVESADTWHLDIGHGVIECDACGWQHPAEAKDVDAYMAALAVAATARDAARAAELRAEDDAQSAEWNRAEDGRDGYEADVRAEREAFIAEDRAAQAADDARFYSEGA